jgi:sugar phosphate isomerase/epimerase
MINRRSFLQQSGALLSAAVLSPAFAFRQSYKLGLQLYTIREAMEKDVEGTLKKVSGFGYEEVEIYGFNDTKYYGYAPKEFKAILDDNNLTTPSGHYDIGTQVATGKSNDEVRRYIDQCISGAKALGQKYIVWPWLNPELRNLDGFKKVADNLNRIGEQLHQADMTVLYHNHDFEFVDFGGKTGYDIILAETDAENVKMQMDLYWLTHSSKLSPHDYFVKYPGRFVSWHLKDMSKVDRNLHEVMGEGSINFANILKDVKLAGCEHLLVEQGNNYHPDAMENVSRSAKYVKDVLFKDL